MADLKTKPTLQSVSAFLGAIEDEDRRRDCLRVADIMTRATGHQPRMWGTSIVGFGTYHYKYESGREGDWLIAGFSPRKANLTLYLMSGFKGYESLLQKLGKHKTGGSCLYIRKLSDVDPGVLEDLVKRSAEHVRKTYKAQ